MRTIDVADTHQRQIGERSRRGFGDNIGQWGRAAFGNHHGRGSGGVRGADDRAEIMRVFDSIEDDVQSARGGGFLERHVFFNGSERDHALMRGGAGSAVERFPRLETQRNPALAAQIDQLLQARTTRTFGDQNAIDGPARPQRFPHGMDSCEDGH